MKFQIEVDGKHAKEVSDFLDENGIEYIFEFKLGAEFPQIFEIAKSIVELSLLLIGLYKIYQERRKRNEKIDINIIINNQRYNLALYTPEEIENEMKKEK